MSTPVICTRPDLIPIAKLVQNLSRQMQELQRSMDHDKLLERVPERIDVYTKALTILAEGTETAWFEIMGLVFPKDAPRMEEFAANDLRPKASVTPINPTDKPPA